MQKDLPTVSVRATEKNKKSWLQAGLLAIAFGLLGAAMYFADTSPTMVSLLGGPMPANSTLPNFQRLTGDATGVRLYKNTQHTSTHMPSGPRGNWKMTFDDEFSGTSLNSASWSYQSFAESDWSSHPLGTGNPSNQQSEFDQPANCSVRSGSLRLTAKPDDITSQSGMHYNWSSCLVISKYSFHYGYLETSAKFPADKGFWPALWTWSSSNQSLGDNGETDVFEYYSDNKANLYLASHIGASNACTYRLPFDPTAGFHTYGVDIEPTCTSWYVDSKNVCSVSGTSPSLTNIILDNFVYSKIPPIDGTTGVAEFQYVRVWQK